MANNLANAVRFRQRQVLTAIKKEPNDWTVNEKEIMDEIAHALPVMCQTGKNPKDYKMPTETNHFLNYSFLDCLLKVTKNPDYLANGLPKQSAQQIIKVCVQDMKGFYASMRSYKRIRLSLQTNQNFPAINERAGIVPCQSRIRTVRWSLEHLKNRGMLNCRI